MLEGKAAILNGPSLRRSHSSAILSMLTAEGSGQKRLLKYNTWPSQCSLPFIKRGHFKLHTLSSSPTEQHLPPDFYHSCGRNGDSADAAPASWPAPSSTPTQGKAASFPTPPSGGYRLLTLSFPTGADHSLLGRLSKQRCIHPPRSSQQ